MEARRFVIKRGFTDNKKRRLVFRKGYLVFESGDRFGDEYTILKADEITEFRFGIRWIKFELTYGREYQIFVRDKNNKSIKIIFRSYFRRNLEELHSLYIEILNALSDYYFDPMRTRMVEDFANGKSLRIGDVFMDSDGISFSVSGIASKKRTQVSWENLRTKAFTRYISLYDVAAPAKVNRGYDFHEDWNAILLYYVVNDILISKGIGKS